MILIYLIIALFVAGYCFNKSIKTFDDGEDLWSFIWNATAIGIIISMFRI